MGNRILHGLKISPQKYLITKGKIVFIVEKAGTHHLNK
jgi:hypothetical protein